jgi:hypothetical protein
MFEIQMIQSSKEYEEEKNFREELVAKSEKQESQEGVTNIRANSGKWHYINVSHI